MEAKATKRCPYCAESVLTEARKCKHCGEYLDESLRSSRRAEPTHAGLAAALSMMLPGAGQVYRGNIPAGTAWCLSALTGYTTFFFPGLMLHMMSVADAYSPSGERKAQTA